MSINTPTSKHIGSKKALDRFFFSRNLALSLIFMGWISLTSNAYLEDQHTSVK